MVTNQALPVLTLSRGEPDFDTPAHVKEAAWVAMQENFTKYTPIGGIAPLREAIAHKLSAENKVAVDADSVVITLGAKQALFCAFQTLLRPGDEVIMMAPYWAAYILHIEKAGGRAIIVPTYERDGWQPDPTAIRAALSPATRAILICSPSNPTGAVYSAEFLSEMAEIVLENDLYVIADEVYEKILFDDARHYSIASLDESIAQRCFTVNSFSKTYSMTGWRVGYVAAPPMFAQPLAFYQGLTTSPPSGICQRAALAALTGDQAPVERMRLAYLERRDALRTRIDQNPWIDAHTPRGAFYYFLNFTRTFGRTIRGRLIDSTEAMADLLREEAAIMLDAGKAFGSQECIRLAFSVSPHVIEEAMNRIEELLDESN